MAVLTCAGPAMARDLPDGGLTATEVANWLVQAGYPAQVKADPTTPGDQIVSTKTDEVPVDIYLYDCSGDGDARRCTSMQYAAGWAPKASYSLDKINGWNSGHRYIKAYLTTSGSLYGEYDLDVSPGGTYEMLNDCLQNWRSVVVDFTKYFNG
ncbi:MAG TPA: YbjN domain-containing protein [Caulobacteraceae bacterium]